METIFLTREKISELIRYKRQTEKMSHLQNIGFPFEIRCDAAPQRSGKRASICNTKILRDQLCSIALPAYQRQLSRLPNLSIGANCWNLCKHSLHKFRIRPCLGKGAHILEAPRRKALHFRKGFAQIVRHPFDHLGAPTCPFREFIFRWLLAFEKIF